MASLKILYANINSYNKRKLLINNYIENNAINCVALVEIKTDENSNTRYRDWYCIKQDGHITNTNKRGGSLLQVNLTSRPNKQNPITIMIIGMKHFTFQFHFKMYSYTSF